MRKISALFTVVILVVGFITPVLAEGPGGATWTWGHYVYYENGEWDFHCDGTGEKKCALNIVYPETGICSVDPDELPGYIEEDDNNYYYYASEDAEGTIVNDDEGTFVMVLPKVTYSQGFCPGE